MEGERPTLKLFIIRKLIQWNLKIFSNFYVNFGQLTLLSIQNSRRRTWMYFAKFLTKTDEKKTMKHTYMGSRFYGKWVFENLWYFCQKMLLLLLLQIFSQRPQQKTLGKSIYVPCGHFVFEAATKKRRFWGCDISEYC